MTALCHYFDIGIDSEHDAFDDACANADLFRALVEEYDIDIDGEVKKYIPHETEEFTQYIAAPVVRKAITEFYGVIKGFSIDNMISEKEMEYLKQWKADNSIYNNQKDISNIISVLDLILADNVVTIEELEKLQEFILSYLDDVSTHPTTLATQILDGILRGITIDEQISESECKNLRKWLYDNIHLSDNFPFNKTMEMLDKVLEDSIITQEESVYIQGVINELLNPVEALREQINTIEGKHVCLSGNFEYGQKSEVEKVINEKGGIIDSNVKKTTDILIVGNYECQAYSNGTYGTKVKRAIEYNEKGCKIKIIKESDLFSII